MIPPISVSHAVPWVLERELRLATALAAAGRTSQATSVVVANSHWQTAIPTIGVFSRADARQGELAESARALLEGNGLQAHVKLVSLEAFDSHHSVWVPLSLLFDRGLPPVIRLSVQPTLGVARHVRIGEALRPLTANSLLTGSGSLTHDMGDVRPDYAPARYAEWAETFSIWMMQRLAAGDLDALLDDRRQAPSAAHSHPQEDHLRPLFVAPRGNQWDASRVPTVDSSR